MLFPFTTRLILVMRPLLEFQVIVDMPNGTTLEQTARVTQALAVETQQGMPFGFPPE
jgi:hypothetical protein